MEERRIVCIGTTEQLTRPESLNPENGRYYRYPSPGKVHEWGGNETAFVESDLPGHEFIATYQGGPPVQGYGLLILSDTYMQQLKVVAESTDGMTLQRRNAFEMKIAYANERVAGLIEAWWQYGTVLIAGKLPTPEELSKARGLRKAHAENLLLTADNDHRAGRHPVFQPVERAWAREFGIVLADTLEARAKVKPDEALEDTPCPECTKLLNAQARRCYRCQAKWGKPLIEHLAEVAGKTLQPVG